MAKKIPIDQLEEKIKQWNTQVKANLKIVAIPEKKELVLTAKFMNVDAEELALLASIIGDGYVIGFGRGGANFRIIIFS